jgi:heterogeneous nuclear ribonucleoprotein A1/A3
MSKKLFVGGLSWGTSEDDLRGAFDRFGEVSEVKIISDQYTGRSRGFGFVSFNSEDEASEALQAMNGTTLDGRTIRVDRAEEKNRSDRRNGRDGQGRDSWNDRDGRGGGGQRRRSQWQ